MCVCQQMYVHVCTYQKKPKLSDYLELEISAVVSSRTRMLGTELGSLQELHMLLTAISPTPDFNINALAINPFNNYLLIPDNM